MTGFLAALRSELYLGLRSTGLRVLLLVPPIAGILRIALCKVQSASESAREAFLGGSAMGSSDTGAYGPFVDGLSSGLTLQGLILTGLAAYTVAADREQGTIRHLLTRHASRMAIVGAKFVFLCLLGLVFTILLLLASWGGAAFLYEFAPPVVDGYEMLSAKEVHEDIYLGFGLAILPLPAAIAFGLFISMCARGATQAVSVALGVTLAIDLFKGFLGDISYYIYFNYTPAFIDRSYLAGTARYVRGDSDVFVEKGINFLNIQVSVYEAIAFLFLTLVLVRWRRM